MLQLLIKYSVHYNALFIYSESFPFEQACPALQRSFISLLSFWIHFFFSIVQSLSIKFSGKQKQKPKQDFHTLQVFKTCVLRYISVFFFQYVLPGLLGQDTLPPCWFPSYLLCPKELSLLYLKCKHTEQVNAQKRNLEAYFRDNNSQNQSFIR